jgi:hypothetical protein
MSKYEKPQDLTLEPEVKIEEKTRYFSGTEDDKMAKFYLDNAADKVKPSMSEHLGSIGIHIYRTKTTNSVEIVTQNMVGNVNEQIIVLAMQQATKAMMESYGHRAPARRKK